MAQLHDDVFKTSNIKQFLAGCLCLYTPSVHGSWCFLPLIHLGSRISAAGAFEDHACLDAAEWQAWLFQRVQRQGQVVYQRTQNCLRSWMPGSFRASCFEQVT